MKILYIAAIYCLIAAGCSNRSDRLCSVLEYSGPNRTELEKVLNHYSTRPADSLKYRAAVFLIENMPGHYSYGGKFMKEYIKKIDSIPNTSYQIKKVLQTIPNSHANLRRKMTLQEDVKHITADFLIHNIETAFRQWQTLPWLADLDFTTFREYLLPYRVENEPLDHWRDSIRAFKEDLEYILQFCDDKCHSIHLVSNNIIMIPYNKSFDIPEPEIKAYAFDCIPISIATLFSMRTIGIPAAMDFIPGYANRNGRHYWVKAMDRSLRNGNIHQLGENTAGKVYRKTYSHNPIPTPHENEYMPLQFRTPFIKDVTDEYLYTADVNIQHTKKITCKYAYLAVFNDLDWGPICYGEAHNQNVTFKNIGKNILYLPVYYEGEQMLPLSEPFILDNQGYTHPVMVSRDSLQNMHLVRKYPYSYTPNYPDATSLDTFFECADNEAFTNSDTIRINRKRLTYNYETVLVDSTLKKRYWRFHCKGAYGMAEIEFIDRTGTVLKGRIIGTDTINAGMLFDNEPLTFKQIFAPIGMDFGKPVSFPRIRYLPKNDANGIYPDNRYELLYYTTEKGWVSAGIQTATGYHVDYNNVPAGGLYWLRNLTKGKEERIFTWKNRRARFW